MEEEKKPHGHWLKEYQFKPGQSGNPNGISNPELTKIRRLTKEEVCELATFLLENNINALQEMVDDALKNPDSKHSSLKIWIARIVLQSSKKGDAKSLDLILNRIVGKVADNIKLEGLNTPQVIVTLPAKKTIDVPKD